MAIHVAILLKPYLRMILSGQKTIESRLTRTSLAPYQKVTPGERIYFKASSGPFMATAIADAVRFHDDLSPRDVASLKRELNDKVCGDSSFWQRKRDSRYASFIWLRNVEPIEAGPVMAPSRGLAWFALDQQFDPMHEVTLTAGALRNGYVRVPAKADYFPVGSFKLVMPDKQLITTEMTDRGMLRWRGWTRYFQANACRPGVRVRFVRRSPRRYVVTFPGPSMQRDR